MPNDLSVPLVWPEEGVTRVPFRLFSDPEIYELEQERVFKGPVWHYLCLEIDLPNPGDFKTTSIGELPVVVTRDHAGDLHATVNRCAHKGTLVCLKERGYAKDLTCAYHAWSYNMSGEFTLDCVPLRPQRYRWHARGFRHVKHRLQPIASKNSGLIFGTFDWEVNRRKLSW